MPYPTQSTGDLVTASMWNNLVIAINSLIAHKTDGSTLEFWGGTAKTIGPSTGDLKISCATADQSNAWLRADGRTIGNDVSGGTARANGDMVVLFEFLWNTYSNSILPIQNSAGSPTTRGASANADFNAGKRLPLPDMRGRIVAGMDNPGSGAANRITSAQADINGGVMGSENHTLTTTEMPAHGHVTGTGQNFYTSSPSGTDWTSSSGSNRLQQLGATANAGSGGAHLNTQPTFFANYFIYTGN